MWSRNSGEDRQSSGLENWRQMYLKRGSRPGSRSISLRGGGGGEPRCQPWGVAPPGSPGPGCPAAGEGVQSLDCQLHLTLSLARNAWPALPLAPLTSSASWKTRVPQASEGSPSINCGGVWAGTGRGPQTGSPESVVGTPPPAICLLLLPSLPFLDQKPRSPILSNGSWPSNNKN